MCTGWIDQNTKKRMEYGEKISSRFFLKKMSWQIETSESSKITEKSGFQLATKRKTRNALQYLPSV